VGEALTSVEAAERLRQAGVDPRREPGRIDAVAAQILLEEALGRGDGGDRR
jgi:RNase H-fold protein (predicted Holliday junction resolvase)